MHGKRRCRVFGDATLAPPLSLSLSLSLRIRSGVCANVCSTACGRPRLASGLYRDYICKTIRLNHFLNKRARPPPLPARPAVRVR